MTDLMHGVVLDGAARADARRVAEWAVIEAAADLCAVGTDEDAHDGVARLRGRLDALRCLSPMRQAVLCRPEGHLTGASAAVLWDAALELGALYLDGASDDAGPIGRERRRQLDQDRHRATVCHRVLGALTAFAPAPPGATMAPTPRAPVVPPGS